MRDDRQSQPTMMSEDLCPKYLILSGPPDRREWDVRNMNFLEQVAQVQSKFLCQIFDLPNLQKRRGFSGLCG